MNVVDLVAVLAILQFLFFSVLVARARREYAVKAPAVTGHDMFERTYRVQVNTMELLVAFLPSLYLAAKTWSPLYAGVLGALYLLGRLVYWRIYMIAPERRSIGFLLSLGPIFVLALAAFVATIGGIVRSF